MVETCYDCVFERVRVDFMVLGNARISWSVSPHLHAPAPWTFQLQVANTDVETGNWTNVGDPLTDTFFALDPTRRAYGKELDVYYRVILTTGDSTQYVSPVADVYGNLDIRSWRQAHEITRKELVRLQAMRVGVQGHFLKVKTSGVRCPVCIDQNTDIVTDSNCPTCFGTKWDGGYYSAIPMVFGDVTIASGGYSRELERGEGLQYSNEIDGLFIAFPFMATNDVWIGDGSDLRYRITEVKTRTYIRGVPVLVEAKMRSIPFDNVIYTYSLS